MTLAIDRGEDELLRQIFTTAMVIEGGGAGYSRLCHYGRLINNPDRTATVET